MLSFKCKDIGFEDDFEIKDENEDEIMKIISLHAEMSHGKKKLSPEEINKIKLAIQDDHTCGATCSDFA